MLNPCFFKVFLFLKRRPRRFTLTDIPRATNLAIPGQVLPEDAAERMRLAEGEALFGQATCPSCHIPVMALNSRIFSEPNPYNPAGTFSDTSQSFSFDMTEEGELPHLEKADGGRATVRAYTDLKRHNLCDDREDPDPIRFFCNEELAQNRPDQDGRPGSEFFLTRKLWDVGNSAPYGHRGDITTITEAIRYHGGEARESRDAFMAMSTADQQKIVAFLKTLQVLPPSADGGDDLVGGPDCNNDGVVNGLDILGIGCS